MKGIAMPSKGSERERPRLKKEHLLNNMVLGSKREKKNKTGGK